MKYSFKYLFTLFFILSAINLMAQKVLSEGLIQYDVSVQTGSSHAKMADAFDGALGMVYVKGSQSRTELKSAIGNSVTIYDSKAGTGVVIREFGSQKLLIRMNAKNWADKNKKYEGITFTNTGETKKIAGYNCVKADARLADGTTFTVFYTTELVMENKSYEAQFKNIPGVPLEYESIVGSLRVKYSASKVSFDPVPIQRFEIPTSGYREMTYDESVKAVSSN
jgi:GLPGLI family protein